MNDQDQQQQQQIQHSPHGPPGQQQAGYYYNEELEDAYVSTMVYEQQDGIADPNQGSPIPTYVGLQNVAEPRGYLVASFFSSSPNFTNFFYLFIIYSFIFNYLYGPSQFTFFPFARLPAFERSRVPRTRFHHPIFPSFSHLIYSLISLTCLFLQYSLTLHAL